MTPTYSLTLTTAERHELHRTWRGQFATRQCVALDFLLYALLRGKDPHAGFTPISNTRKLHHGMSAEQSYQHTLLAVSNMAGHRLSAKLRTLFPSTSSDRLGELVGGLWHSATAHYYGKKESAV